MDQDDEDLQMALKMSMQPPEPKRSKPGEAGAPVEESPESKSRRVQRELMAAAAEKRMMMMAAARSQQQPPSAVPPSASAGTVAEPKKSENLAKELSVDEANQLFSMVFGSNVSKEILAQWTNQGIRLVLLACCYNNFSMLGGIWY